MSTAKTGPEDTLSLFPWDVIMPQLPGGEKHAYIVGAGAGAGTRAGAGAGAGAATQYCPAPEAGYSNSCIYSS